MILEMLYSFDVHWPRILLRFICVNLEMRLSTPKFEMFFVRIEQQYVNLMYQYVTPCNHNKIKFVCYIYVPAEADIV